MDEKYREGDFSEAELEHEEQELEKVNDIEVHRSTRQRKTPSWHSDYVMTSYNAYCLQKKKEIQQLLWRLCAI